MNIAMRRAVLPLRARLTLMMSAALMAVLTAFGLVLYLNIHGVLLDSTAQSLRRSAAAAIGEKLNSPNPPKPPKGRQSLPVPAIAEGTAPLTDTKPLTDLARLLTTHDTAARTTDTGGVTVGDGPALAGITTVGAPLLDTATYRDIAATNAERHLQVETPAGPVMVELIPLTRVASSQPVGVLQLSTSLQDVDDLLSRLRSLLVVGTLLALLATAALTVLIVRGGLRPVRRMATASRAIADGDLSRRVAVPPGGDELTDLARAFNQMVGRLDAAFSTQRRFIADVSHELRSPLTSLGGGVEALMMGADRGDPVAHARLLRMMEREIARMGRLVDDLLTLTRFDADPASTLALAPVDLVALVAQVVDETRLLAGDRATGRSSSTPRWSARSSFQVMPTGCARRCSTCAPMRGHTRRRGGQSPSGFGKPGPTPSSPWRIPAKASRQTISLASGITFIVPILPARAMPGRVAWDSAWLSCAPLSPLTAAAQP